MNQELTQHNRCPNCYKQMVKALVIEGKWVRCCLWCRIGVVK
jgi:hypothetical protein